MGFFDRFKKKIETKEEEINQKSSESNLFDRLKKGLAKTKQSFSNKIFNVLSGRKIDQALIDEIEEILITSDISIDTADKIINNMKERAKREKIEEADKLYAIIKEEILTILNSVLKNSNDEIFEIDNKNKPHTILVVGVNGAGKTTTIGKLSYNYKKAGKTVIIGAADTFRAAANEQLEVWANRANVEIIQKDHGADPSSVAYETMQKAVSSASDVVIIDTAGRLHNKLNLMKELEKMSKVMSKLKNSAPDDVYLVLDGTTGQNAIQQAKEFSKVANITGIVLTKLDGTAKGGVVISIIDQLKIPVRYIGVGEQIDDLQVFKPENFVEALFGSNDAEETFLT